MFHLSVGRYELVLAYDRLPSAYGEFKKHASLCDEFGIWSRAGAFTTNDDGRLCYVSVSKGKNWPFLVVAQRYEPSSDDFFPGVALVEDTSRLFIGAGDRILCYDLSVPARIWEDGAKWGFWSWSRHGDVVVMSADEELAAWYIDGGKLWSTSVEPPWEYAVTDDQVHLDVMGAKSIFSLYAGR
jgi:hypothetical protein